MEPAKEDRRRRRTRQLLRNAFVELLGEKSYQVISVQDIIERADVARSTFYLHYLDKEDLFLGRQGIFADKVNQHLAREAHKDQARGSILSTRLWFDHLQGQRDVLKAMIGDEATDVAMKNLRKMVYRDIEGRMKQHLLAHKGASIPPVVLVDYLVSTLMALINWWIRQEMPETPERMDELFQQLVMPGLHAALERTT
jgi:AcrR family transcriptional regulator